MQKVNLLPSELASVGINPEVAFCMRRSAIILAVLAVVLILAGVGIRVEFNREVKVLADISAKVKEKDLIAEGIEDLKDRESQSAKELDDVNAYLNPGLMWSKKLIQLGLIMPEEVWVEKLTYKREYTSRGGLPAKGPRPKGAGNDEDEKKEFVNLSGALIPAKDLPPINTLSGFVNKLKSEKEFFSDFDDLLITDVKTAKKDKLEVMGFEIRLVLKR